MFRYYVVHKDDTLHVYAPGPETVKLLQGWGNRLPAFSYAWGGEANFEIDDANVGVYLVEGQRLWFLS